MTNFKFVYINQSENISRDRSSKVDEEPLDQSCSVDRLTAFCCEIGAELFFTSLSLEDLCCTEVEKTNSFAAWILQKLVSFPWEWRQQTT